MVTVCQKCGDKGFTEVLVYCDKCGVYAIHCYCLDVLPASFAEQIVWFCDDCEPQEVKPYSVGLSLPAGKSDVEVSDVKRSAKVCTKKDRSPIKKLKKKKKLVKRSNKKIEKTKDSVVSVAETTSLQLDEVHSSEDIGQVDMGRQLGGDRGSSGEKAASIETKATHLSSSGAPSVLGHSYAGAVIGCDRGNFDEEVESGKTETALVLVPEPLDIDRGSDGACSNEEGEALEFQPFFLDSSDYTPQLEYIHAQPIIEPIWRGSFSLHDGSFGLVQGVIAHLSSLACSKVYESAKLIPELLCLDLVPRSDVWPKGFEKSGPSDESIALYFFTDSGRDEEIFDGLVDKINIQDLAMRATVQDVELLLFSSVVLPLQFWRFQGKFYLWGVFRRKQASHSSDSNVEGNDETKAMVCDSSSPVSPLSICYSGVSGC